MKKKEQAIEDWRITVGDERHSEWMIDTIKKRHSDNIFSMERWNQKIIWEDIEKQANHVDVLVTYLKEHKMPPLLFKYYIDLIHTSLQVLRDIVFVNTGFYLDPMAPGEISEQEGFKKLRFWTMGDLEVTGRLCNTFERLVKYSLKIKEPEENYGTWKEIEKRLKGTYSQNRTEQVLGESKFNNTTSWCMDYAFAPYEYREGVWNFGNRIQLDQVRLYIDGFFSLFFQLSVVYQIEEESLPELVDEMKRSEYGENRMKGWRKDMNLSREDFIEKLESVPEMKPWVRGVVAVLEEKQHIRSLFSKADTPYEIDIEKCSNVRGWMTVILIVALLQEYEGEQAVVQEILPFFYMGEKDARDFLNRIRGAEPQMITTLVKKLVEKDKMPEALKTKSFYNVLKKHGLYTKSYENWNQQM